ncbi:ISP2-like protein [Mya arenaria]|uniref:ISP2-like protein n=1 Tax=Mya arenaria TaxID=6604 RepID=A0ABY7G370_MYAAR|nr:ISP2-like protein [Mya arenaria]
MLLVALKKDVNMKAALFCLSLLQLWTSTNGEISTHEYQRYTDSSEITGTSIAKTTARSLVRCTTLCAQHEEDDERCHAARYHGETRACELISRSSTGTERWLNDGSWTIVASQDAEVCGDGWHCNEGSSYFVSDEPSDWFTARDRCMDVGATLASIKDQTENTYLKDLLKTYGSNFYWLGGSRASPKNPWLWETGEAWGYEDWEYLKTYLCMGIWVISYNGWHDWDCMHAYRYVCEKIA